jgi:hypothetical protein
VVRLGIVRRDLFHPVGTLAVEPFLNGDVWRIIRLSIPVLFQMGFILVALVLGGKCTFPAPAQPSADTNA